MSLRVFKSKEEIVIDNNNNSDQKDELNCLSLEQIIIIHKEQKSKSANGEVI